MTFFSEKIPVVPTNVHGRICSYVRSIDPKVCKRMICDIVAQPGFALARKKMSPSLSPSEKSWGQPGAAGAKF